jgi:hypothetical protein
VLALSDDIIDPRLCNHRKHPTANGASIGIEQDLTSCYKGKNSVEAGRRMALKPNLETGAGCLTGWVPHKTRVTHWLGADSDCRQSVARDSATAGSTLPAIANIWMPY